MERKLHRSRTDRMISGVCGGIAEFYGIDPTLVRLVAVLLALVSAGAAVIAYIVMAIVVPEEGAVPVEGVVAMSETPQAPYTGEQATASQPPAPPSPPVYPPTYAPAPVAPVEPQQEHATGRGGIVFGLVLVFVGLALLASQFIPGLNVWKLWPLIIVVIGIRTIFRGGE